MVNPTSHTKGRIVRQAHSPGADMRWPRGVGRLDSEVNGKANLSATGCPHPPLLDRAANAHIYFTFINFLKLNYVKFMNFVYERDEDTDKDRPEKSG